MEFILYVILYLFIGCVLAILTTRYFNGSSLDPILPIIVTMWPVIILLGTCLLLYKGIEWSINKLLDLLKL